MLQTRKSLKMQIKFLQEELDRERQINKLIDESGFEKCKGIACCSCEHAIKFSNQTYIDKIIGCDLRSGCPSYKRESMEVEKLRGLLAQYQS